MNSLQDDQCKKVPNKAFTSLCSLLLLDICREGIAATFDLFCADLSILQGAFQGFKACIWKKKNNSLLPDNLAIAEKEFKDFGSILMIQQLICHIQIFSGSFTSHFIAKDGWHFMKLMGKTERGHISTFLQLQMKIHLSMTPLEASDEWLPSLFVSYRNYVAETLTKLLWCWQASSIHLQKMQQNRYSVLSVLSRHKLQGCLARI